MAVKYVEITENLSPTRLYTYRTHLTAKESGLSTSEAVKAYFLLNDISQHFFVPLQQVEVVLRNRINTMVINTKGKENWYESVPATIKAKDAVTDAKALASEETRDPKPKSNDIICRLMFGFWANLLDSQYRDSAKPDHFIWDQRSFKAVFPGADRGVSVGIAFERLRNLSNLRNRLFHHEPIWKGRKVNSIESAIRVLDTRYTELIEVLQWLSPETYRLMDAWSFHCRMKQASDATRFDQELW